MHPCLCHKDTAKGERLWVPWAVPLWHKRAELINIFLLSADIRPEDGFQEDFNFPRLGCLHLRLSFLGQTVPLQQEREIHPGSHWSRSIKTVLWLVEIMVIKGGFHAQKGSVMGAMEAMEAISTNESAVTMTELHQWETGLARSPAGEPRGLTSLCWPGGSGSPGASQRWWSTTATRNIYIYIILIFVIFLIFIVLPQWQGCLFAHIRHWGRGRERNSEVKLMWWWVVWDDYWDKVTLSIICSDLTTVNKS